jgi:cytochrome c553
VVARDDIDAVDLSLPQHLQINQRTSTSAMPPLVSLMSRHELRDIVEYIATQTATVSKPNTAP